MPAHQHHVALLVALHLKPGLLVDRVGEGSLQAVAAAGVMPASRRIDQRRHDGGIIDRIEAAEMPRPPPALGGQAVELGGYPSERAARSVLGDEMGGLAVGEERRDRLGSSSCIRSKSSGG